MFIDERAGLIVLIAPPGVGKTVAIETLATHYDVPPFRYLEPIENRTKTWVNYPADLLSAASWSELSLLPLEPSLILMDSLRVALFESGGTTLSGGFTAGALRRLTELNNLLVEQQRLMITPVNPIYPASDVRYALARSLISASVSGVIEAVVSDASPSQMQMDPWFLGEKDVPLQKTSLTWEVFRDRDGGLDEVASILNNPN